MSVEQPFLFDLEPLEEWLEKRPPVGGDPSATRTSPTRDTDGMPATDAAEDTRESMVTGAAQDANDTTAREGPSATRTHSDRDTEEAPVTAAAEDASEAVMTGAAEDAREHIVADAAQDPGEIEDEAPVDDRVPAAAVAPAGIDAQASLNEASQAFSGHMLRQGFSNNTIKAFEADLRLFARRVGDNKAVGKIGQADLEAFMTWLRDERDVPCSPKSYARRLTTLKVFFGWLNAAEVLDKDPAAPLAHVHPTTPLPEILYDGQINDLLRVTRDLLWARKPDARPYLLITLLIQTGIKKGECMEIKLEHIDLSNLQSPVLFVRYLDPRKTLKERRLALGPNFAPAYRQYLREYQPKEHLFECTARNLEYVLEDAAALAEIPGGCSFEQLRWTCAVRDYRNGMTADQLRQKMGLSMITWRETLPKIQKLARPAL